MTLVPVFFFFFFLPDTNLINIGLVENHFADEKEMPFLLGSGKTSVQQIAYIYVSKGIRK